ncbi:MAG TPA: MMPL family transporter, partial [Gaiellaceae bacterium]
MSPLKDSKNVAARMGRWSARHRKTAIFGWLAFVVAAFAIGIAVPMQTIDEADWNVGEARKGDHIIRDGGFSLDQQAEFVLIQSDTKTIDDAAFRAVVNDAVVTLGGFEQVTKLRSPLEAGNEGQISKDGHSVLIQFSPKGTYDDAIVYIDSITAATEKVQDRNPDYYVGQAGSASTGKALDELFEGQLAMAGLLSIPLTLGILLLVFGSVVGASIPLLLGLTSVVATLGLVGLPSHIVPMDENISAVILLIGLAVGVDYSLFYIRRERDERRAGRSESAALEAAAATSGRAVLISGITVMIAMAGMFFSGDKTFMSFAIGTMMVVAVAMIGSLTVLPAMLSWLGDRVDKVRVPLIWRLKRDDGEPRVWGAILDRVLRRPVLSAAAATAVLLALAAPALTLNTAMSGIEGLPASLKELQSYNKVNDAFPG